MRMHRCSGSGVVAAARLGCGVGWRRTLAAAAVAAAVFLVGGAGAARAVNTSAFTATVVNFDGAGHQVSRYDTVGNAVDAHDGVLVVFGGVYYLYGTSYGCGYGLLVAGTRFCGFKVYSSPDLTHWTDRGLLFDAGTLVWQSRCAPPAFGCYRPHVVFNAMTSRYVLWVNGYDNRSGFHVLTSTEPTGPFAEVAEPTLAVQGDGPGFNNGDMDVFVDDDGVAYLAYTDIRGGHSQVVEKLDPAYTSGTGAYVRLAGSGYEEAPALFRRGDVYYYVDGPSCPYCAGTATLYRVSTNGPLGQWSVASTLNATSCGGQPSFVARLGSTYLYGSDLWRNGAANEALANYYWAPLTFTASGALNAFGCVGTVDVDLAGGSAGSQVVPVDLDQSDGVAGFRTWCDIRAGWQRMQTFVAGRTGWLTTVSYTTFQNGNPDAPLQIEVYRVDTALQPAAPALVSVAVTASAVGWSPRELRVPVDVAVTAGRRYGIVARSAATTGCYGMTYNDAAPYPGGGEAYSATGGSSYVAEPDRSSKFWTAVRSSPPTTPEGPGRSGEKSNGASNALPWGGAVSGRFGSEVVASSPVVIHRHYRQRAAAAVALAAGAEVYVADTLTC
jgi:hypothetical protein